MIKHLISKVMIKHLISTATALFIICCSLQAQGIKGRVVDENDNPLEFVNVVMRMLPDSTFVTGTITSSDGCFELEGKGDIVQLSMIGYQKQTLPVSHFKEEALVTMFSLSNTLDEVVVISTLPKTSLKGNALVTDIAGSVLEHEGNALDVLGKVPGMISMGGNLEVIGRGAPLYYVNGRKVTDNAELRNLMSEDIKSIDVISNPGAEYGGEVRCVVRIRTVKRQGEGFSYALTSQAKQYIYDCHDKEPSWSVLDLNYRWKGWDLFGKVVYWNQRGYQISNLDGGTITKVGDKILDNRQVGIIDYRRHNGGWQYMGGANWQINEKHSLGFRTEWSDNTIGKTQMLMDEDVLRNEELIDHLHAINDSHQPTNHNLNGNLYYDGTVDKLHINFNADYVRRKTGGVTDISETSWTGKASMQSNTEAVTAMTAAKLVLSYPVWKGELQMGMEETYVSADETYAINFTPIPNSDASMEENTLAGFAQYSVALPFGQFSAGLRYEHAKFDYADHINTDNNVHRSNDSWFPSISFSTKLKQVRLSLSYTGKTIRPRFETMSKEISYDNKFTYQTGDPLMKNEIQRTLSLMAQWKWISFSGNYERVDNKVFQRGYPYNDEGVAMIQYTNAADPVHKLSAYLTTAPSFGVWYPRYTVGIQKQFFETDVIDPRAANDMRRISLGKPMYLLQIYNSFRLKKSWIIDLDYQYISPFDKLIYNFDSPIHGLDVSVGKSFLKNDALSFKLSWSDVFNTKHEYVISDFGNCYVHQDNRYYSSALTLRVSYRFNSAQNKYKGTGAGESAKNRM